MATAQNPAQVKSKLTPAQRNQLFAAATRQHIQKLPSHTVVAGGSISFEIPKARYMAEIILAFKGTLTATHATETAFVPATYSPYNLIKKVRAELNNGFSPFNLSGKGLALYNRMNTYQSSQFANVSTANARGAVLMEKVSSSGGTSNDFRFIVRLPVVLNDRDPVGLINVQNPQTVCTVTLDFNELTSLLTTTTGFTLASAITVTPTVISYSIPIIGDAQPDLSVLKLVNEQVQAIAGAGDVTVKLPVGQTYRKIGIIFEDASGGEADADIGEFQLILNQADYPYRVDPFTLQAINQMSYGTIFNAGEFVFDFTNQGIPNLGGARDYIDTERLTEFWLRSTAAAARNITVITETLARLAG